MSRNVRTLERVIASIETSDGAGVKLRRSIGSVRGLHLDPFLMLDEFGTDDPDDYIAGFPAHPHRGFETVTYMLEGRMQHRDHLGNIGDLGPGAVQWMTAGRGVIHSEMPLQERGRLRGFQLWLNLPARDKMRPAAYRDIPAAEVPLVSLPGGGVLKVIAGRARVGDQEFCGPVNSSRRRIATDPAFLDLQLPAGARFEQLVPAGYTAFVYVYEGTVHVGEEAAAAPALSRHAAGVLADGDCVVVTAGREEARLIVLAARPLGEPVVQYGPFVMNTREQIEQAIADYRQGVLTGQGAGVT